jgi:hypothetical protein
MRAESQVHRRVLMDCVFLCARCLVARSRRFGTKGGGTVCQCVWTRDLHADGVARFEGPVRVEGKLRAEVRKKHPPLANVGRTRRRHPLAQHQRLPPSAPERRLREGSAFALGTLHAPPRRPRRCTS